MIASVKSTGSRLVEVLSSMVITFLLKSHVLRRTDVMRVLHTYLLSTCHVKTLVNHLSLILSIMRLLPRHLSLTVLDLPILLIGHSSMITRRSRN